VKVTQFQKSLLVRWLNTLDIWSTQLTTQNLLDEIRTGVLLCAILHFHHPKLDIAQGLNRQARSKKPCLNNIEKALVVLHQKGAPRRFVPSAEEIFDSEKNPTRVWLLVKLIFDHFAMSDVQKLSPYILKWLAMSLWYTGEQV